MSLSLKTRFEIFKRDSFTCRYCGKKSPETILEVDHVEPTSNGGGNDEMNLVTSCFDCNRGKGARNLSEIITGEDPHDKAIEVAERERQLREYHKVLESIEKRIKKESKKIILETEINLYWESSLIMMLRKNQYFSVLEAVRIAVAKRGAHTNDSVPYCFGILRNWREKAT